MAKKKTNVGSFSIQELEFLSDHGKTSLGKKALRELKNRKKQMQKVLEESYLSNRFADPAYVS